MEEWKFWLERSRWPVDHPGFVFLGRLVLRLGAALHPDWQDDEPAFSKRLLDAFATRQRIDKLSREQSARKIYPRPSGPVVPPVEMTERELRAKELRARFLALQTTIASAGAGGAFVTYTRPKAGGIPRQISNSVWFTERLSHRFTYCLMRRDDPFSSGIDGERFEYVYIDELGASRLVMANSFGEPHHAGEDVAASNRSNTQVADWLAQLFVAEASHQRMAPTIAWKKEDFLSEVRNQLGASYAERQFNLVWNRVVKEHVQRKKSGPRPTYLGNEQFVAPPIRIA